MSSGRRITIALVGLVLLVIIGYVVNDLTHHHSAAGVDRIDHALVLPG